MILFFRIGITSVSIWRYFRMKLCLFDENCGEDTKVHEPTENQMLHASLKPEFPMICKESIDTMVFFDNRDHALYADAVVDGTGYRNIICKTTGCS